MLTEYDQFMLPLETEHSDTKPIIAHVDTAPMQMPIPPLQQETFSVFRDMNYLSTPMETPTPDCDLEDMSRYRWATATPGIKSEPDSASQTSEETYTITDLNTSPGPARMVKEEPLRPWEDQPGLQSWNQHGPGHLNNDSAQQVSGSDGGVDSSDRRPCVNSLLQVALQKGSMFAQQYSSCGVPLMSTMPNYYTPDHPVQPHFRPDGSFVSSTSASPRSLTPADSFRIRAPRFSPCLPTTTGGGGDEMVSTTTGSNSGYSLPQTPPASPYVPFRTPYSIPSPDGLCQPPPYPVHQSSPYQGNMMPLPLHLLPTLSASPQLGPPSTPPTTPVHASKRRRCRPKIPSDGNSVPPRKRERSERQLHPCHICDKRFKDNYSVNVHLRTHTGEKPFGCQVCGKMFRQKAHLAKHKSTHQASEFSHLPRETIEIDSNGISSNVTTWVPPVAALGGGVEKCKSAPFWTPDANSHSMSAMLQ